MVCGHIHAAADRRIGGVRYLNCGDWVDTCSAIVEHFDGRIEVVHWGIQGTAASQPPAALPLPSRASATGRQPRGEGAEHDERIYLAPDI